MKQEHEDKYCGECVYKSSISFCVWYGVKLITDVKASGNTLTVVGVLRYAKCRKKKLDEKE